MARDELFERRVLAQIGATRSLSRAARSLGVTVSTATRVVQRVEATVGARLFTRMARGVAPTDAGLLYLAHVERVLAGEAEAQAAIAAVRAGRAGTLRVSVPVFVAERLLPDAIARFTAAHPGVHLDVHASDDLVDVRGGGFDLAVRAGPLADSTLRTRKLVDYPLALAAAPALIRQRGPLRHPGELATWPTLGYGRGTGPLRWGFRRGSERVALTLTPLLHTNNVELLIALVARGLGAALVPALALPPSLSPLLTPWCERLRGTLHAVYPDDPGRARIRTGFLDALARQTRAPARG